MNTSEDLVIDQRSTVENLKWRYATKKFDRSKAIENHKIEDIKKATNLAPTSYGLQPFRVVEIEDEGLLEKIKPMAFDQPQITQCNRLFIFCAHLKLDDAYVDEYLERMAETRNQDLEKLKENQGKTMKDKLSSFSQEKRTAWATRQAYIALGMTMAAAADNHVDTCPMEGFEGEKIDELLNLESQNLKSVVLCAVGHRHDEDDLARLPKVRLDLRDLFIPKRG